MSINATAHLPFKDNDFASIRKEYKNTYGIRIVLIRLPPSCLKAYWVIKSSSFETLIARNTSHNPANRCINSEVKANILQL